MAKSRKRTSQRSKPGSRSGELVRILIARARVKQRVRQLAHGIRRDFPKDTLHLVAVLKGAVLFLADLARELGGEVSFDFMAVSSYGKGTSTTGEVKLIKDLDVSIEGRTVIVVEDILDTGLTLKYLLRLFEERKPKHLRVVVLLDKADPERSRGRLRARLRRTVPEPCGHLRAATRSALCAKIRIGASLRRI